MKNTISLLLLVATLSGCDVTGLPPTQVPTQCSQLPIAVCQNSVLLYLYSCTMSNQYGNYYAEPSYRVATSTGGEVIKCIGGVGK
jgi:hypothetical protein